MRLLLAFFFIFLTYCSGYGQEKQKLLLGEWELAFYEQHKEEWSDDSIVLREDVNLDFKFLKDSLVRTKYFDVGDSLVVTSSWSLEIDSFNWVKLWTQDFWTHLRFNVLKLEGNERVLSWYSYNDVTLDIVEKNTYFLRRKGDTTAFKITKEEKLLQGVWQANLEFGEKMLNCDTLILYKKLDKVFLDSISNREYLYLNYSNVGSLDFIFDKVLGNHQLKIEDNEECDSLVLIDDDQFEYESWSFSICDDNCDFKIINKEIVVSKYGSHRFSFMILFVEENKLILIKVKETR